MAKVDLFLVYFYKKKLRMQKVDDLANTLSPFYLARFYFGRFFIECRIVFCQQQTCKKSSTQDIHWAGVEKLGAVKAHRGNHLA